MGKEHTQVNLLTTPYWTQARSLVAATPALNTCMCLDSLEVKLRLHLGTG